MNRTKIEWALNPDGTPGYTWNPITGCLNGCEYCYARKLANTRLKERYLDNSNLSPSQSGLKMHLASEFIDPFYPRFWERRMLDPRDSSRGKGIFVCDMSDLFGIGIPEEWTQRILREVRIAHDNRFYLLTKQPQNLAKWDFPDNAWVGVSATDQEQFIDAMWYLHKVEAKVKYISFEPLLERMNGGECEGKRLDYLIEAGIKWVIIGSQTGTLSEIKKTMFHYPELTLMPFGKKWTLQPKIEWVKEIVEACDKAGIPVFLKENLRPLLPEPRIGLPYFYKPKRLEGKRNEFEWILRQELPQ